MSGTDLIKESELEISQIKAIEHVTQLMNEAPPASSIQKTPDGNAQTMGISFVEAKLDEIYMRQWGTEDVQWQQLANEVLVTLTLWVVDPQTKLKITRSGFAAVQITTDACPEELKYNKPAKNAWSLNMENKKPNAMYMAFPKAKSEALKNAAKTLGNAFGRNLNRKFEDSPQEYWTNLSNEMDALSNAALEISEATTPDHLNEIWKKYPELQNSQKFQGELNARAQKLGFSKK